MTVKSRAKVNNNANVANADDNQLEKTDDNE